MGLPFAPKSALLKGTLIHTGLSNYYERRIEAEAGRDPNVWFTADDAIRAKARREGAAVTEAEVVTALDVVANYVAKIAPTDPFKTIATEHMYEIKIADKYPFTARIDHVIEWRDKIWFSDHKSTYRIDAKSSRIYVMSGQFAGHRLIGKTFYGERFGGVMINFLETGPTRRVERITLQPAPEADRHFADLVAYAHEKKADLQARYPDPNDWPMTMSEHTCFTRYGACSGFDLCVWGKGA